MKIGIGQTVYHGWRYWKTTGLESGEVLGWNTLYLPYRVIKVTPKQIVAQHKDTKIHLKRDVMEGVGKQYHTRFHEYFYAEKPRPDSKDWNWEGNKPDFKIPSFRGDCLTTLGLSLPVTAKDVKRAYKRLALKTHPDLGGDAAEFIKVNQAYESALRFAQA